jgi:acetyl-CoA acetyltransferase
MVARAVAAFAGLGMTEMTRVYTRSAAELAADAIRLAIADAGMRKDEVDGLLLNTRTPGGGSGGALWSGPTLWLQSALGLRNLRLVNHMYAAGSTAGQMVQYAALAIQAGMASAVLCVFTDTPMTPGQTGGGAYGAMKSLTGMGGLEPAYGFFGANVKYALAARRHMGLYGTTQDQLGAIAVSNRKWAAMNPAATYRSPLTLEEYHRSRWVVEPFHVLDCTLVNNGAVAVLVTSAERARGRPQPPVYILGMGQGHPGNPRRAPYENEVNTGAALAKDTAFGMAGISAKDVDVCELYDCYTYTSLVTLEDYGFCAKGEGGAFVSDGKLEPGGSLPTNTGGGQLSAYYMWGMTPISEAIMQARGGAGARQVPKHDCVLVTSQGGVLDYHACLVLSPHASTG